MKNNIQQFTDYKKWCADRGVKPSNADILFIYMRTVTKPKPPENAKN